MFSRMAPIVAAAAIVAVCGGQAAAQMFGGGIFQFIDRNRDGWIDEDEFEQIRSPMREWLVENGYTPDEPIPVDELMEIAPEMIEDLRRAREEAQGDGPDGSRRFDFRGRGEGSTERGAGDRRERGRSDRSESDAPAKRETVTVKLPDSYREADLDGDGQIGLYEWKVWKPGRLDEFIRLDANGDGFLTPRELVRAEKRGTAVAAGTARPGTAITGRMATVPTSQTSAADGGAPPSGTDRGRTPPTGGFGRRGFGGGEGGTEGRQGRFGGSFRGRR